MATELYLASTPLHILNSIAISSKRASHNAHLILIDQVDIIRNPYFQILSDWKESPFKSIEIFQGHIKKTREKLTHRKAIFKRLDEIITTLAPRNIYTGNDRRIEFQYAMHAQEQLNGQPATGVYMDEGTFTYVGRKDSASFSDKYVDNILKKITYGWWWDNPITIGGSGWIKKVIVAFPSLLHPFLHSKEIEELLPYHESNSVVQEFCNKLVTHFQADTASVKILNIILTLPHDSIIERMPRFLEDTNMAINNLLKLGYQVGVKYHPRNQNPDILGLSDNDQAYIIPHKIPFEAILPLLNKAVIVGDISSTLINSRFLQPDARVISIANHTAPMFEQFKILFGNIGVPIINPDQLNESINTLLLNH